MNWSGRHAEFPASPNSPTEEFPDFLGPGELTEPASAGPEPVHVDLDDDPFADDLADQLAAKAPRRFANRATVALAGLVLLVGGFLAGAQVEKHFGTVGGGGTPTTFPTGARGNFAGLAGGQGGQGGSGASSGTATTGTIKFIDGTTVYITTANGDVITVKTTGSTTVSQPGSLKDLPVGATVTVTGPAASDGTVTASRISKDK
jgi:hypothetical protein